MTSSEEYIRDLNCGFVRDKGYLSVEAIVSALSAASNDWFDDHIAKPDARSARRVQSV